MKIRILVSSEGSFLNTGYGKYALELLKHLHSKPEYEVAEFAAYGTYEAAHPMYTPNIERMPWKIFCNIPATDDAKGNEIFKSNPANEFGRFRFETACVQFRPDVVLSFRDHWMDAHIDSSPLRRYYRWVHMPTIDAEPQKADWLDAYRRSDILLTYSDWAIESLKKQNFKGRVFKSAPPAGTVEVSGVDKLAERKRLGIPADAFVAGTVMRNQPRKLYDNLFSSFAKFAEGKSNVLLYCHTGYPDVGWNLPDLMVRNGIADKVLFTYTCQACGHHFASRFNQALSFCPKCGKQSAIMANTKRGVSHEEMSLIMSTFDLYCQIANSEGFGLPQVEAAAVGVPVIATDYSAMSDVVRKLGGIPIKCTTVLEPETNCMRGVPDTDEAAAAMEYAYGLSDEERRGWSEKTYALYTEHYNWTRTCTVWEEAIKLVYNGNLWSKQPVYCDIPEEGQIPNFQDAVDFIKYCYIDILKRPDLCYSYEGQHALSSLSSGFNQSGRRNIEKVTPKQILERIVARAHFNNFWESKRMEHGIKR